MLFQGLCILKVQDRAADGLPREKFGFVTDRAILELHTSILGSNMQTKPDFGNSGIH